MVTKTRLPNYNLSYKTRDLLKDFGNKISQRNLKIVNCIIPLCVICCTSPQLCCVSLISALHCIIVRMREFDTMYLLVLDSWFLSNTSKYIVSNSRIRTIMQCNAEINETQHSCGEVQQITHKGIIQLTILRL